jgi:hypothetical protein
MAGRAGRGYFRGVSHADVRGRLGAYADGTLDDAAAEQVRAHLATGCAECLREVFGRPVGVARSPIAVPRRTRPGAIAAAVLAGGVVGVGIGLALGTRRADDEGAVRALASEVARLGELRAQSEAATRERLAQLEARVRDAEARRPAAATPAPAVEKAPERPSAEPDAVPAWLQNLLSTPGARLLPLRAAESTPGAKGYAAWSPTRSVVVVSATDLPYAENDRAVYRVRVSMSDGSTAWVGDLATATGTLLVTVSVPQAPGRRLAAVDLYRDPPGTPVLTATLRS